MILGQLQAKRRVVIAVCTQIDVATVGSIILRMLGTIGFVINGDKGFLKDDEGNFYNLVSYVSFRKYS
jgi:hypothetical protein